MTLAISANRAQELLDKAKRAQATLARTKERVDDAVGMIVSEMEASSAAFGLGIVASRFGQVEVLGVPLDLLASGGLHALGLAIDNDHLHSFGMGASCAYSHTLGFTVGAKMKEKARLAGYNMSGGPTSAAAGYGGRVSDATLHGIAGG